VAEVKEGELFRVETIDWTGEQPGAGLVNQCAAGCAPLARVRRLQAAGCRLRRGARPATLAPSCNYTPAGGQIKDDDNSDDIKHVDLTQARDAPGTADARLEQPAWMLGGGGGPSSSYGLLIG
jgi:hypothetical protein